MLLFLNSFLGDPSEEGELLTWLLYQMKEDTIENINRDLLFKMISEEEFLGVFFCEYELPDLIELYFKHIEPCSQFVIPPVTDKLLQYPERASSISKRGRKYNWDI